MPINVEVTYFHRSEDLPAPGRRVWCYSPEYQGHDESLLYRTMDSEFVRISTDVDYWAYADESVPVESTGFSEHQRSLD